MPVRLRSEQVGGDSGEVVSRNRPQMTGDAHEFLVYDGTRQPRQFCDTSGEGEREWPTTSG